MPDVTTRWHRSTFCADSTCVEVAQDGDVVFLRDGKNVEQHPLRFSSEDWHVFLDQIVERTLPIY